MIGEYGRGMGVAVAAALPAILAVAALYGTGVMAGAVAAIAGAAAVTGALLTALLFVWSLAALGRNLDRVGLDTAQNPLKSALVAPALWDGVLRLRASCIEQIARAGARFAAADAVLAAIADPLLLIDSRRRVVRSNRAATEFVGRVAEPRDLAGTIRNPALLAAVDAVLRGESVPSVEFTVSLPVERVLRAHLARIDDGLALDAVAAKTCRGPCDRSGTLSTKPRRSWWMLFTGGTGVGGVPKA